MKRKTVNVQSSIEHKITGTKKKVSVEVYTVLNMESTNLNTRYCSISNTLV